MAMQSLSWQATVSHAIPLKRSLSQQPPAVVSDAFLQKQLPVRFSLKMPTLHRLHSKHSCLQCTKTSSWEPTPVTYAPSDDSDSARTGSNIFESLIGKDAYETLTPDNSNDTEAMKSQPLLQLLSLKLPMWLLGPSVLLVTGVVPTLWLPLSSVFLGPSIGSLLSLIGLDCIFNIGATLFLLMSDACARPKSKGQDCNSQIPRSYCFWNMGASVMGFVIPLIMLLASNKGFLQPQLPFISFSVLLGPYLLLLSVQMLTDMLTWHWKSPVWLVTPIVYEAYRILQLMRGLKLGVEIGAPAWMVDCTRGLVSWWVLILGMQLMRVAWFAGFAYGAQQE